MSRPRTVGTRSQLYPYFVATWLTPQQHAKLQALAQAHDWTKAQTVRALVQAFEVRPMALTVHVSVPEGRQDDDA